MKILTISDLQGHFSHVHRLVERYAPDIVVHTGNLGLWTYELVDRHQDAAYVKQIVAFSTVLPPAVVEELNDVSTIASNPSSSQTVKEYEVFRGHLEDLGNPPISEYADLEAGRLRLPVPVYSTYGPLDDPGIINSLQQGHHIANLHLIDHQHLHEVATGPGQPNLRLFGVGGNVKIHSLFDRGLVEYDGVSGKVGDLWVTLTQISELYQGVRDAQAHDEAAGVNCINVFVSYAPVIKTPLLEHVAIVLNSDFSVSQGLHFRYPVMGNGMSFVDSMGGLAGYIENYRSKFSRLRMILGELWLIVRDQVHELCYDEPLADAIELGLNIFDKIPVSINDSIDKIIPLSLHQHEAEDSDTNKLILKKLNDYYFLAYYNLWHFNLSNLGSDDDFNVMVFELGPDGNMRLNHCLSSGFNFKFKAAEDDAEPEDDDESLDKTKQLINSSRGSRRGRSRARGRPLRGRRR